MIDKVLRLLAGFMGAMWIAAVALTVIGLVVSSCGPPAPAQAVETYQTLTVASEVRAETIYGGGICMSVVRIEDYKHGNVIYVVDGCSSDGIVVVRMEDR